MDAALIVSPPPEAQILTVNVGSSSVKLDLVDLSCHDERAPNTSLHLPHRDIEPGAAIRQLTAAAAIDPSALAAIGHRLVHGGTLVTTPLRLTNKLDSRLDELAQLAPLHNPITLAWIRAVRQDFPGLPQILVPDTGFFSDLPTVSRQYALPADLTARHGLRRYGFHGLAHESMLRQWLAHGSTAVRIITLQLGAGCSMAAIADGRPIDTSMGFSPLEGLMMATRSGDVDAGLVTWLQKTESLSPAETEAMLNERSGLLGVSRTSADVAELLQDRSDEARLAIDMYVYRARKYLGAYMVALGGVDAILFGGGVGEHVPGIRQRICGDMSWCGVEIDRELNDRVLGTSTKISSPGSTAEVGVVRVDEARILAEHAARISWI